ncbi:PadR family transcriptional regulator [Deinococcus sp.]|uniref:PadR family transcriptional regulator n=1 Tax=Deinococcus sp. TaxID=47478 RepID=UPI003CC5BC78
MTDASQDAAVSLGPVGYIVLGMLAQCGPLTSYELKREVDGSVGYFWSFPRSQLYAEPQRLTRLGYLEERQEQGGRRRRVFSVTGAGRAALAAWLSQPAGAGELRDPGLLKLFFARLGPAGSAQAIAAEQLALHRRRLAEYRALHGLLGQHPPSGIGDTLPMGLLYEEASVRFWSDLAETEGAEGAEGAATSSASARLPDTR